MSNMILMKNITKSYGSGNGRVVALDNISLEIRSGEMVAVTGKSGSGKSTLLHLISGLDRIDAGDYFFNQKEISTLNASQRSNFRRKHTGMIVQSFALVNDKNVFENIALPLKFRRFSSKRIAAEVSNILTKLGLMDKKDCYPYELSGGQKQRVAIGRALISQPEIILADEPTGALDLENEAIIMDLFKEMNKEGKTIIIVTHDEGVSNKCNRKITLKDGKII